MLHHSVMHSQQKRWPHGVAVECLRSSKQRVHSGALQTALSSRELLWGEDIAQVSTPTISGLAKVPQAPCTPSVGQIAVQPPLLPGSLLLPEAVQLQPHGQCQMQQGDKPQQSVAGACPQVLSRKAASPEL